VATGLTQKQMKSKVAFYFLFLLCLIKSGEAYQVPRGEVSIPFNNMPQVFPGTSPFTLEGDLSAKMLDGAHKFIEEKIKQSVNHRAELWHRDFTSKEAYEKSIEPHRKRFMKIIGVADKSEPLVNYDVGIPDKNPLVGIEKFSLNNDSLIIAQTSKYKVYQVRWPVLNRVNGEGLLLEPTTKAKGDIIVIPDAGQQPEQLVGLSPGIAAESQIARRLAENGFRVLVPVIISRTFLFPGKEQQQTYREWIYRQAFHMGRHIIGYEVQKILSAVDWFKQENKDSKIGVVGYNEGGLLAFYSAAVDNRIDAVLVSGYFTSRQKVWDEPIYRNVWSLLSEFGDAEIASLIAPRPLVIEYSEIPELVEKLVKSKDNPTQVEGLEFTGYKGRLQTPDFKDVQSEFNRIDELTRKDFQPKALVSGEKNAPLNFGSKAALEKFTSFLAKNSSLALSNKIPVDKRRSFDAQQRQIRQVKEIEDHVQWLVRDSDQERKRFFLYKIMPEFGERVWTTRPQLPYYSPNRFIEASKKYRKIFNEEILGKFNDTLLPFDPHTRKIYDKEKWTGYEVTLDVYPDLFAAGILLIPKDIKHGEKRPVVVIQHGRSDIPQKIIEGNNSMYNDAAAKLAEQGFIVYAPQNPYRGEDRYRWLNRKANTVGKTLFSFIVSQHSQTLRWLKSLPFVDEKRIAFYGLSYGGETAMRVPAVLEDYCLSICSGDFGDWTRKVTDTHYQGSFMNSLEWEMPYFNMGSTFSYAEMAYLIFPRPFMVERGHHDLVQPDEWVAYEYAKVRYFYDQFNLGDRTDIEFFNGGHSMKSEGTFRFLHKHLNWP
jgi:dienelactone hydrolase